MATRAEIAVIALLELGGDQTAIHTEDIAIRAAALAPGMFAWQKHRDRVDKELVRVALSDARLKAARVIGSHAKGWMLTPLGVDFARAASSDGHSAQPRRRAEDAQLSRERARLVTSDAFATFRDAGADAVTAEEADAFFRLNLYVRGQARERKIARIENQFRTDPELGTAVTVLAARARERTQ